MRSAGRTFDNEWVFQAFEGQPSFFTKRMFSGLAAYLHGRMMMVLIEPASTGRWTWHGVFICTQYAHQPAIMKEFPQLAPHDVLKKWLYIDTRSEEFESTLERVAQAIERDDHRFGIPVQAKRAKVGSRTPRKKR